MRGDIDELLWSRPSLGQTDTAEPLPTPGGRHLWRGASGRRFRFSTVSLIGCPQPAMATFVLVRRDERGNAVPLHVGVVVSSAPTLNLARIRCKAARVGASEIHLRDVANTGGIRAARRVARDIRRAFAAGG